MCRLLGDHRDEGDRGPPDLANRALRIPCRQLHDEDLVFRPSRIQAQQRARFVARLGKVRQEVFFRQLGDPARIGHQVGELGKVRDECRSRGDTMTSFVEIPGPRAIDPIVATGPRNKAHPRPQGLDRTTWAISAAAAVGDTDSVSITMSVAGTLADTWVASAK